MEADPVLKENTHGDTYSLQVSDGYIAEKYYMDLVGQEWTDTNEDYKFDRPDPKSYWDALWEALGYYTPGILKRAIVQEDWVPIPEIWTSRIFTSTLTGLFKKSEGQLVNAYLEKNHAYRTGQIVFPNQTLLYSLPAVMKDDNAFSNARFIKARNILSSNSTLKEPNPPPAQVDEFFKPLKNESYEILFWGRHGMKTSISLGSQSLTSDMLANTPIAIATAFVFPISCLIGHYTQPGYFSGSYIFNERFIAFGMPTATLPTYGNVAVSIMSEFVDGVNLGTAFKRATEIPDFNFILSINFKYFASLVASWNSRFILGDGTLKLQSNKLGPNQTTLPQQYINEKYTYDEERLYNYMKDSGKRATEFDKIEVINQLFKTAFARDDYWMINTLKQKGADITIQDQEGNTLLHLAAAEKKDNRITELLLKEGLDIKTENKLGKTSWDIAKEHGNDIALFDTVIESGTVEQVEYLIENGANVNGKNKDHHDDTPLHTAAIRGDTEIIRTLLKNGADINARSSDGSTPFRVSANGETVKLLLENGADINAKDDEGFSKLHMAVSDEDIETIKILIQYGADVNSKNKRGATPLDLAGYRNNPEALELLKNAGAETKSEL